MSVLAKKWVFIESCSDEGRKLHCEDDSIFTEDGEEVIGCSEWMRCDKETFVHIVELHNASIGA